jgi:glycosyltransferase involved in cell wall biosynthesis
MDISKVCFEYAGPHFDMIHAQAKKYGVEEILADHDFVSRSEAYEIQCRSDVFLVLSWNTEHERGVLTGKFYEGIRAGKPILSMVTGELPNSELNLINEKYHYGYCYEICRAQEQYAGPKDWVEKAYVCKRTGKAIPYDPEPGLFDDFCYENLAKQLEKIMTDLTGTVE